MLKAWTKWIFLICLCHVEVHVKAHEAVSFPKDCWSQGGECALQASHKLSVAHHDGRLTLLAGSVVQRNIAGSLNVIEGSVLVLTLTEGHSFQLPNGHLVAAPHSKLKIQRLETGMELEVLTGLARMTPRGKKEVLNFPAGYKAHFGWVNNVGEVPVNLPRSLSMPEWVALFHGFNQDLPLGKLKAQMEVDLQAWRTAVETATSIQKTYADRSIAAAEAKKQRQARLKVQREAEDRKLRELFRAKNNF